MKGFKLVNHKGLIMSESKQLEINFISGDVDSLFIDSKTMEMFGKNLTPLDDIARIYKMSPDKLSETITDDMMLSYERGCAIARARIRQRLFNSNSPLATTFLGRELLGMGKSENDASKKAINATGEMLKGYYGLGTPE
jgi:hypothetical protein